MYCEVIFEDGTHSVANYADEKEALSALEASHERAMSGGRSLEGDSNSPAATRIVKVLMYEEHPGGLNEANVLPVAVVKKKVAELAQGDLVSVEEVAAALKGEAHPMVASEPHESNYKMEEVGELEGSWS